MIHYALFAFAIYILIRGEFPFGGGKSVRGWKARVVGAVLALAFPTTFVLSILQIRLRSIGEQYFLGISVDSLDFIPFISSLGLSLILAVVWRQTPEEWSDELSNKVESNVPSPRQEPSRESNNPYRTPGLKE